MQKRSLEICCYVCGAGAFGVFFRWLQNQMAFDDAGLNEKSVFNFLVPLLILAAAMMFRHFINKARKEKLYLDAEYCAALRNPGQLFTVARWIAGAVMSIGSLLLLVAAETDVDRELMSLLAILGFFSGLAYPVLLGYANREWLHHRNFACLLSVLPIATMAFWLIICYKKNALNSVPWDYLIEMAAVTAAMFSYFRAAGFAFGTAKGYKCLFAIMLGTAMCIMALADERYMGMQIMLLGAALQQILYVWIIVMNMKKREPRPRVECEPEDGFERL